MDENRLKVDLVRPGDISAALGLLTRLPVRVDTAMATHRGARAAWAWPLAGLVVGALACFAGMIANWLGLGPALAALVVIAVQVALTGAMHEDGLADSADGLWGGWTAERRLAIMKDSRTGAYGVIALVLSLLLRWTALSALFGLGYLWIPVLLAGVLSRVPMVALMIWLPPARAAGLSRSVGQPTVNTFWLCLGVATVIGLGLGGLWALQAGLLAGVVTVLWGLTAKSKIGGQTGDILGASQQLTEITVLCVLVSAAG